MTDHIGSDALNNAELEAYREQETEAVRLLERAAAASADARTWLASPLGQAVRGAIVSNKHAAMKDAATSPDHLAIAAAQKDYAVWQKVEVIFAAIITEGEAALAQLYIREDSDARAS